jgi:hypothetical protein
LRLETTKIKASNMGLLASSGLLSRSVMDGQKVPDGIKDALLEDSLPYAFA